MAQPIEEITLPCFGFEISLVRNSDGSLGGTVSSDLTRDLENDVQDEGNRLYRASVDVVESFVLAAACAGVDVVSNAFIEAIETVVQKIQNLD